MISFLLFFKVLTLICFIIALVLPFTKANSGRWSWTNAGFVTLTLALFWPWL